MHKCFRYIAQRYFDQQKMIIQIFHFLKGNRDNHFPPFCRWITSVTPSSFAVPFRLGRNGRPMYIYQTLFDVRNVETPTATIDSSLIKMCGFTRYDKKSSAVFDRHLK